MTAAEAARRFPFEGLQQAPGSRDLLEQHLEGVNACQLEAFNQVLALATERASLAFCRQDGWLESLRAGLTALLEFFDEEPALARYLIVHSAHSGEAVLARRREILDRIAVLLDDERAPARAYPPPLTAHAVASGVLGVLFDRLSKSHPVTVAELVGPLMSFTVLPFLGLRAARRELARPVEATPAPVKPSVPLEALRDPSGCLNRRAASVLSLIGAEPGLNSRELASRAAVKDEGQMSRLLSRLDRLGLIQNTREAQRRGDVKAWQLTIALEELGAAISYEPPAPAHSVALELMRASGQRLSDNAIGVLRVIGSEPGLSNNDVAVRVGTADENSMSQQLARLARRGLVVNNRTGGKFNAWHLTSTGDNLERAIWHETPAAAQHDLALGMLRDRGGRLNHRVASVLKVIGAEPELSNNEIAERVRIEGKGHASTLLSRLARFGLIENLVVEPAPFEANAWQLTPTGKQLQKAIRDDCPGR